MNELTRKPKLMTYKYVNFFQEWSKKFQKKVINCMRNERESKSMEKQNFKYIRIVCITIYLATDRKWTTL